MGGPAARSASGPRGKRLGTAYGTLLRAAVQLHQEHPEIVIRRDALLWSINERLGALLPEGVEAGYALTSLTTEFVSELVEIAILRAKEREEAAAGIEEEVDA